MFWWSSSKKIIELEKKTQGAFLDVKKDIDVAGKWIKHLDGRDKQLFDLVFAIKEELSSIKAEIASLREGLDLAVEGEKNKQVFKDLPVLSKHRGVDNVEKIVQTAVQTDNFYEILKRLSGNERLIIFTLMNSDMRLSYEDLALLLGKERSTIRGQINAIKQKSEGLIKELTEKNGKKRVFIPEDVKEKMQKYAKVRVGGRDKKIKK